MSDRSHTFRAFVAVLTALGVCLSSMPAAPLLAQAAQTQKPATPAPKPTTSAPAPKTATPAPKAAAPAAPAPDLDGGWPRDYGTPDGGAIRIFQPQIASWDGQKQLVAYSAVSYSGPGATKPALGTLKLEANTSVSVSDRLVNFTDVRLTETNFPELQKAQLQDVVASIQASVPQGGLVIALDRVLARLDKSSIIPKNVDSVKADPPVIFYSTGKAVLVNVDGDPVWSPVQNNDLKYAVNTNWDLFQDAQSKALFMRVDSSWVTATDLNGPWKSVSKLPDAFSKLPDENGNFTDVKKAVPGRPLSAAEMPKVFVSTKPAELILLQGPPNYLLVTGTSLLWVSNTENDVFRMGKTGNVYFLVSGRWFSAPDFTGPWTFATTNLPEDFKKIPVSHARSRVLASVPGTDQAVEAVLLAQIPQTARVEKKSVKAPDVAYQGNPDFQPVEQTTVARAVNTDKDIIKVGDKFYMCYEGVWFVSNQPSGPWEVTGSVPKEIYEIPVSSPAYNVTNVTVVEDNSDAVVFATAAAYTGMMVAWGCVVWGSGWYYPPYIGYGGFYPYYRPYYPTYGYRASYNPWTGAYSRGAVAYGPYGGAGVGARYNPRTGTYSRGAAAYGPYGARGVAEGYNPRTGTYAQTRQGSNVYGSWGQTGVTRGDNWATTSRATNNFTGTTTRTTRTSEGGAAVTRNTPGPGGGGVARTGDGDVYAGRDGNVYKRQDGGGWQKYDNGGWNNVDQPTQQQRDQAQQRAQERSNDRGSTDSATMGQLNRDSAARTEGAQRTRSAGSSSAGSGSYRPSGGARSMPRGGGGRRR